MSNLCLTRISWINKYNCAYAYKNGTIIYVIQYETRKLLLTVDSFPPIINIVSTRKYTIVITVDGSYAIIFINIGKNIVAKVNKLKFTVCETDIFSPNAKYCAHLTHSRQISINSYKYRQPVLLTLKKNVKYFCFSPISNQIAICQENDVHLYNLTNKTLVTIFTDKNISIDNITFSPDGNSIAISSNNWIHFQSIAEDTFSTDIRIDTCAESANLLSTSSPRSIHFNFFNQSSVCTFHTDKGVLLHLMNRK